METITNSEDTITFKRSHFYSVLVVLAFAVGISDRVCRLGRTSPQTQVAANDQPVVQAPAVTQAPQFTRYDIPADGFPRHWTCRRAHCDRRVQRFSMSVLQTIYDETYQQLMDAYPGKIRFVYRHLPLTSIHPEAFPAAEASMCANEQNAFPQYHNKLFENQETGRDLYLQIAADLSLDTDSFEERPATGRYKDLVQQDLDFALNLGVQSTPTFFINGLAIVGAQPISAFKQVIDMELAGEIPKEFKNETPESTHPPGFPQALRIWCARIFFQNCVLAMSWSSPPSSQGRVTWSGVSLYDAPAFTAREIHRFGVDQVVEILAQVEGDDGYGNPYNNIWYQVDNGYTYSGWISPWKPVIRKRSLMFPRRGSWARSLFPSAKRGLPRMCSPPRAIGCITAVPTG